MILPSYQHALSVASRLTVLDQSSGAMVPFILNEEQRRVLRSLCQSRRLVVLKGRQVGCSTVVALCLMLIAVLNPGLPLCVVADDHGKAKGLMGRVKGWLSQIGVLLIVDNMESMTLENGASIDALTANSHADDGEAKTGRSKSYGFIHATEMAFWRNAPSVWAALTSTMLSKATLVVESTGTPGDGLFRQIFDDAGRDGWESLFFGTEDHENYRLDPTSISDSDWETLQGAYGFKRRDSAAWWWRKLWRDFKGDAPRMLREYPIEPEHGFTFREGLHIAAFTEVPVRVDGDWNYYLEPSIIDEPIIIGVDTSEGLGLDASTIAGVGQRTGRVLFTWRSNETTMSAFTAHVRAQIQRFSPVATVIEKNGVGASVYQELQGLKGVTEQVSGSPKGEVKKRRDDLRDAIVTGEVAIGGHLVDEVKSSMVKARKRDDGTVRVVFVGKDDVLSAVSFARKWREANAWCLPAAIPDRRVVYVSPIMRQKRRTY